MKDLKNIIVAMLFFISINNVSAQNPPIGVTISNITEFGARVSWSPDQEASYYGVSFSQVDLPDTQTNTSNNYLDISYSGYTNDRVFEVKVRKYSNGAYSNFSAYVNFVVPGLGGSTSTGDETIQIDDIYIDTNPPYSTSLLYWKVDFTNISNFDVSDIIINYYLNNVWFGDDSRGIARATDSYSEGNSERFETPGDHTFKVSLTYNGTTIFAEKTVTILPPPPPLLPEIFVENITGLGNVLLGNFSQQSFVILNEGTAPLTVSLLSSSSEFLLKRNTGTFANSIPSFTIAAGSSEIITVQFTPTILGETIINVTINSNDTDESSIVRTISGIGVNTQPAFSSVAITNAVVGEEYTHIITITDIDQYQTIIIDCSNSNGLTFIDNGDKTASLSGTFNQSGNYNFIVIASDGYETVSQEFTVEVESALPPLYYEQASTITNFNPMAFILYSLKDEFGQDIIGCCIGAFSETGLCIASTQVTEAITSETPISISLSSDETTTDDIIEGYINPENIIIKVWIEAEQKEYTLFDYNFIMGDLTFESLGTTIAEVSIATENVATTNFSFEDIEASPGDLDISTSILCDNQNELGAIQFNFNYDPAIQTYKGYLPTNRTSNFIVSVTDHPAESYITVLVYSMSGDVVTPGTGAILDLLFDISETATIGITSELSYTNVVISDVNASLVLCDYSDVGILTIVEAFELGDINGDNIINILDLQLLINIILGTETGSANIANSDLNNDGLVNILDLQLIINLINSTRNVSDEILIGSNKLILPEVNLNSGEKGNFAITLENNDTFSGCDFEFTYNSSIVEITAIKLAENFENFELAYTIDDSNSEMAKIHAIVYSTNSSFINKGLNDIIKVEYKTTEGVHGFTGLNFSTGVLTNLNAEQLETSLVSGYVNLNATNIVEKENIIKIYPNPTSNICSISYEDGIDAVTVVNAIGQVVFSDTEIKQGSYQIDLSNFATGVYSINVFSSGQLLRNKIIKQ